MKNNNYNRSKAYFWRSYNRKAMWRVKSFLFMLPVLFLPAALPAQTADPILKFMGTDSVEEINPYDFERLEDMLTRPLQLNHVSESRLTDSGLLSAYQAASLADYRSRHGDVLSFTELAAVDGFGREFVGRLMPFVALDCNRLPGAAGSASISNDIAVRTSARLGTPVTYGLKYRIMAGETMSGGLSLSRTSDSPSYTPDAYSGHFSFHFRRRSAKILIGDFNARFGQGLALWNGMGFSGLTSASSFMKRPSGISASSSFTGGYAFRGVAGDVRLGHMKLSVMTALDHKKGTYSILPAANVSWFMKNGMVSLTHYADFAVPETAAAGAESPSGTSARIPDMKTSAGAAFTIRGVDIFAETAFDWVSVTPAALAGIVAPAGDDVRMAAMLRYYPSSFSPARSAAARSTTKCANEYAASLAADFSAGKWVTINGLSGFGASVRRHAGKASVDFAYFPEPKSKNADMKSLQVKAQAEWDFMIAEYLKASLRVSERVRTWGEPFRTDLRTDVSYMSEHFLANMRLNGLLSAGAGILGYIEGGYRMENLILYARTGLFRIDNWAARIYVYERDAPGSFNVPAYYGRGVWAAFTGNWRFARWGRMYIRAAMTSYPFMKEKKPGRAELKIQFVFRL